MKLKEETNQKDWQDYLKWLKIEIWGKSRYQTQNKLEFWELTYYEGENETVRFLVSARAKLTMCSAHFASASLHLRTVFCAPDTVTQCTVVNRPA